MNSSDLLLSLLLNVEWRRTCMGLFEFAVIRSTYDYNRLVLAVIDWKTDRSAWAALLKLSIQETDDGISFLFDQIVFRVNELNTLLDAGRGYPRKRLRRLFIILASMHRGQSSCSVVALDYVYDNLVRGRQGACGSTRRRAYLETIHFLCEICMGLEDGILEFRSDCHGRIKILLRMLFEVDSFCSSLAFLALGKLILRESRRRRSYFKLLGELSTVINYNVEAGVGARAIECLFRREGFRRANLVEQMRTVQENVWTGKDRALFDGSFLCMFFVI